MKKILKVSDSLFRRFNERFSPSVILWIGGAAGLIFMMTFWIFNVDIYRDSANCYTWLAREFSRGVWDSRNIEGLPPLIIFLSGWIARSGIETFFVQMLLSGIFYLLTMFPLYGILRRLCSPKMAAWGALLFIFTPKIIRFSGMGLLEASRDFFLISAFYFLFAETKWKNAVMLGLSLGLLSLARGEGMVMAGLVILLYLIRIYRQSGRNTKAVLKMTGLLCLTGVSLLTVTMPRMVEMYRGTGYPVIDARMIGPLKMVPGANKIFTDRRIQKESPKLLEKNPDNTVKRLSRLPKNFSRGAYELYLIFALLGIFELILFRKFKYEHVAILAFLAGIAVVFSFFSVAYRYFIFAVPLLMVFTVQGIAGMMRFLDRYRCAGVFGFIFAAVILIQPWNALEAPLKRTGLDFKQFGEWLKSNKTQFIPSGESGRKLIVCSFDLPEITYWCDEARFLSPDRLEDTVDGFDVLLISRKNPESVEIIRKKPHLFREIPHAGTKEAVLFQRIPAEKKQ